MADTFAGKGIAVTGGGNGLGKAVAGMMAARGGKVAVLDIDPAAAEAVARAIGGVAIAGDVTRSASAKAALAQATAALGHVDVLVNCAGVYPRRPILEITDADWEFSFSVNVRGTYHMAVAAVEHMRTLGGGHIVNIASIDAYKAHPDNAHYAAMKAAVVSLTKSFGLAFAPENILVNAVAPGAIATEKAKGASWLAEHGKATPIGRAAEPDDIAEVICFLASPANRYMAGETTIASGGFLIY